MVRVVPHLTGLPVKAVPHLAGLPVCATLCVDSCAGGALLSVGVSREGPGSHDDEDEGAEVEVEDGTEEVVNVMPLCLAVLFLLNLLMGNNQ